MKPPTTDIQSATFIENRTSCECPTPSSLETHVLRYKNLEYKICTEFKTDNLISLDIFLLVKFFDQLYQPYGST